ncbi:unnamed protein product [Angiostrongylus costaricensis]|uniref:CASP-like protein n=1 Tax=Angiostrongylus costaricensis TaxID=334426 RepID=A0A0R3P9Z2_ANGCS|nr:unnamed protein product [Angiostrongylus costaricensis]
MDFFGPEDEIYPMRPPYFSPTAIFYGRLTTSVMAFCSALMHTAFIVGTWRLCGIGARSAYLVLSFTGFVGFCFSFIFLVSSFLALVGLKWDDCIIIWQTTQYTNFLSGLLAKHRSESPIKEATGLFFSSICHLFFLLDDQLGSALVSIYIHQDFEG